MELDASGPLSRRGARAAQSWILDFASPDLEELGGRRTSSNGGHWTLVGGVDPAIDGFLKPNARRPTKRSITIAGRRVSLYTMPAYDEGGGYYGGHVVAAWRNGDERVQMSVHGRRNERRLVAMATALIEEQERCPRPRSDRDCQLVYP